MAKWADPIAEYQSSQNYMGWWAECGCEDYRFNAYQPQTAKQLEGRLCSAHDLRVASEQEYRSPQVELCLGYDQLPFDEESITIPPTWIAIQPDKAIWQERGLLCHVIVKSKDKKLYHVEMWPSEEQYSPWVCKHIATAIFATFSLVYPVDGIGPTAVKLLHLPWPLTLTETKHVSRVVRVNPTTVALMLRTLEEKE